MTQASSLQLIRFCSQVNDNLIDFKFDYTLPIDMALPMPGDEVCLPMEVAVKAGFATNIFTVDSRCFIYAPPPPGFSCAVSLKVSVKS